MNNTVKGVLIFIAGAAVGSVVTWKIAKNQCEKKIQAEVDAFRKEYTKRKQESAQTTVKKDEPDSVEVISGEERPESPVDDDEEDVVITNEDVEEYEDILMQNHYINYSDVSKPADTEDAPKDRPYVIPPTEFGLEDDYTEIEIKYYADFVLADEDDNPIEDVEGFVGRESLLHFGENEYDPDTVYVQNDRLKCYIAILLEEEKYSDRFKRGPHQEDD
jgi:hypothetical protein